MGILDFITKRDKINELEKKISEMQIYRPSLDMLMYSGEQGEKIPVYSISMREMSDLAKNSDILRVIFDTRKREIFRNGILVKEKFKRKCSYCGKEYLVEQEKCDDCGNLTRRPIPEERKILQDILDNPVNVNGQTLVEVLQEIEQDICTFDNGYLVFIKEYNFIENKIVGSKIKEIIRASPMSITILANKVGEIGVNDSGKKLFVCVNHREDLKESDNNVEFCEKCGKEMIRAGYGVNTAIGVSRINVVDVDKFYYGVDEVEHSVFFMKSSLYGHSPIISLYYKILTLMYMDRYLMMYFEKQRPPKGILAITTRNVTSLHKAWDYVLQKVRANPHEIVPLAIENEKGGRTTAQFINFMQSLDEMQFIEARNEFRRCIGAVYGTLPLFTGDLPSGWGNEGLQVVVTNRAIQSAQAFYNQHILKRICREFKVNDWVLELASSEMRDVMRELQIEAQKIANAQAMVSLGFEAELTHGGEWKFSKKPNAGMMGEGMDGMKRPKPEYPELLGDEVREQRFEGEPDHTHPSDTMGRFEGEPENVHRSMNEDDLTMVDYIEKGFMEGGALLTDELHKRLIEEAGRDIWRREFAKLGKEKSDDLKRYLVSALRRKVPYREMFKAVRERFPELSFFDVERILRTEMIAVEKKAKEISYRVDDPQGTKYLYKWLVPKDARRCEVCERIAMRSKNGVTMDELKLIIHEEKERERGYDDGRDWVAHPLCRCAIIRVVDLNKSFLNKTNKVRVKVTRRDGVIQHYWVSADYLEEYKREREGEGEKVEVEGELEEHEVKEIETKLKYFEGIFNGVKEKLDKLVKEKGYATEGRVKSLDSAMGKVLMRREKNPEYKVSDIDDWIGMRVKVKTVDEKPEAIAFVEKNYKVLNKKDWSNNPKDGYYRGCNLKIQDGDDIYEIQVMTEKEAWLYSKVHDTVYKNVSDFLEMHGKERMETFIDWAIRYSNWIVGKGSKPMVHDDIKQFIGDEK